VEGRSSHPVADEVSTLCVVGDKKIVGKSATNQKGKPWLRHLGQARTRNSSTKVSQYREESYKEGKNEKIVPVTTKHLSLRGPTVVYLWEGGEGQRIGGKVGSGRGQVGREEDYVQRGKGGGVDGCGRIGSRARKSTVEEEKEEVGKLNISKNAPV